LKDIEYRNEAGHLSADELDKNFYYEGSDLGCWYDADKVQFRVWAPTASEAMLVTYGTGDDSNKKEIPMMRSEKGTWTAELAGNQDGLLYTYKVNMEGKWKEAVDPYARAVTVNGTRGAVVDLQSTNPENWNDKKPLLAGPEDAIIYEMHIRDLSIHPQSGIKHKGKYLGAAEPGTRGPDGVKTGLSHIVDLGVTHVQILPFFDYATVDETQLQDPSYNWGYDPENYNAPEGSYATDPFAPKTRIRELKTMIGALHDKGLRVIMDVVYNHVYSAAESHFSRLVPGYYFRTGEDGNLSNGTGVGNDTASERKMMRKFIVDSVVYWAEEYHLDGFRFDLMGIHDVETMNEVRRALSRIDPSIIILGEGWDLNTPLPPDKKANQKNAESMPGIAHFNDHIRDAIKGSALEDSDQGFINGKKHLEEEIKKGIAGGLGYDSSLASFQSPQQVVVYAEAHDNHTLWDKLEIASPEASEEDRKKMHKLASSIVLTAQGIPLIHAGQEFMRTKGGEHDSYKSPDSVNELDWNRRAAFNEEVEYMKGLIEIRKAYPAFRLSSYQEIEEQLTFMDAPAQSVAFMIESEKEKFIVIHNANQYEVSIELPGNDRWAVLSDGSKSGTVPLSMITGKTASVPAICSYVLKAEEVPS
jgi:pullulanase